MPFVPLTDIDVLPLDVIRLPLCGKTIPFVNDALDALIEPLANIVVILVVLVKFFCPLIVCAVASVT